MAKYKIPFHHQAMEWVLIAMSIAVCAIFFFMIVF